MKHCNKCDRDEPDVLFSRNRSVCKACDLAANRAWRAANAERFGRVSQAWKSANAEKSKLVRKARGALNAEKLAAKQAEYRALNKDVINAKARAHRHANLERINAAQKIFNSTEKGKARGRRYRENNRDKYLEGMRLARKRNPGIFVANQAKRRAAAAQATPVWADVERIKATYKIAARMRKLGRDVHVDHIVPIKNDLVCGLHVSWNLQIIPAAENIAKHNRFAITEGGAQ